MFYVQLDQYVKITLVTSHTDMSQNSAKARGALKPNNYNNNKVCMILT